MMYVLLLRLSSLVVVTVVTAVKLELVSPINNSQVYLI